MAEITEELLMKISGAYDLELVTRLDLSGRSLRSLEGIEHCPNLILRGLMCIGKYSSAEGEASADFAMLAKCRAEVAERLGVAADALALSMGMSHDFELALDAGATHVRVGSTIFGARAPKAT